MSGLTYPDGPRRPIPGASPAEAPASRRRDYQFFDIFVGAYVAILILTNLVGAGKVAAVGPFTFGAGILFFPVSYLLGDVLTEVYGYSYARRAIWIGFGALVFTTILTQTIVALPPAHGWTEQAAYETVFGATPRIVAASITAFWAGEFVNAFVMAKMKLLTAGRKLWTRTIGSTVAGQGVDSLIFYTLAFAGVWPARLVLAVMATNYVLKVVWETVCTPLTYAVVNWLKRTEGENYFDTETAFTPFRARL